MRVSPFTIAEESLAMSSPGGMSRTAAPMGPNMFDSGATTKVALNNQPAENALLQQQNILQNTVSASAQANVGGMQNAKKMQLAADNAEYVANSQLQQYKGIVMDQMGSPATAALGNMTPPEQTQFRANIATGKAMTMGVNPDLVLNQMSEQQYG